MTVPGMSSWRAPQAIRLAILLIGAAVLSNAQGRGEPFTFFREKIALSEEQIAQLARGKPITKELPSGRPSELFIFGAVFVKAKPESCGKLAFDIERLRRLPGYIGAHQFGEPPVLSDLKGFTLDADDVRELRTCRPGRCVIQLPLEWIRQIQEEVNWSGPNLAEEVNGRIQKMALDLLLKYRKEGNRALPKYHDVENPFDARTELQALLGRWDDKSIYLPELRDHLLNYPNPKSEDAGSIFYWEKVSFGMRPTLRLNHARAYWPQGPGAVKHVAVVKQLYASHYLQLALDLSACVLEIGRPADSGFYFISLRGSAQQGLTGLVGSLLRRIIVSRTRTAQERSLLYIKQTLESDY
jgi:hypothetical protein